MKTQLSNFENITQSLSRLGHHVRVQGATHSSIAWMIANHFKKNKDQKMILICPDSELSEQIFSDIQNFLETTDIAKTTLYPNWESSPFEAISPSIKNRYDRISCLKNLKHLNLIVTTQRAVNQRTLPYQYLNSMTHYIKCGESSIARDHLISALLQSGYNKMDSVEDPGTFSSRGEIVDLFPVDSESPIRIEYFDDEIEKIRYFNPQTQRTNDSILDFLISPAREIFLTPEIQSKLRKSIKHWSDENGIPKNIRDPILEMISDGIPPDHLDYWVPFAYTEKESIIHHLTAEGSDWKWVWVDPFSIQKKWDQFLKEERKNEIENLKNHQIAPVLSEQYLNTDILDEIKKNKSLFYFDSIQLEDSSSIKVEIKSNSDLTTGNRHNLGDLEPQFQLWIRQGFKIFVFCSTESQRDRIKYLLEARGFYCSIDSTHSEKTIQLTLGQLSEGFRWPSEGVIYLNDNEIIGGRKKSARKNTKKTTLQDWVGLTALSDLAIGDAIVHLDHGIGKYTGLTRLDLNGAPNDYVCLEYANKDKLYLPIYRLNVIQKHGAIADNIKLDKLGLQTFLKEKDKVKEAVKKLAVDLIKIYAERKIIPGLKFSPRDDDYTEFEALFPFEETPDQAKAIEKVLFDMENGNPMDRLVCGDVGYGKTEVAIRAAYKAVQNGKQVAVLVPTTILAFQHEQSFKTRFKNYPLRIESVSRFKSSKNQNEVIADLKKGKIDILIGTHRLLSKDVAFSDLGLIIVDEEHRFGVEHKEKLKALKTNCHILTLSATPIPRTLHMALSGLRDISLISTPPVDRLPIKTYISTYDEGLIKRSIETELSRGGQVFFVHNRVQSIQKMAQKIEELIPQAKVLVAHGQMTEGKLEEVMLSFYEKKYNVLVCSTIIESGLDIPSANTIIINRADTFGLAQLYQIRGRVGRGQNRGYAYLLIPDNYQISDDAKKRLEVIQKFVDLGSGFNIASHDLEIRGGGDLLGPQQSGHIAAVGFDLYLELLEEAIVELKGQPHVTQKEPEIKAPFSSFLSEEYIPDIHQRLSLYRRLSSTQNEEQIVQIEEELQDRFGPLPHEAQNLLWTIRIKDVLKKFSVETLTVGPEKLSILPSKQTQFNPAKIISLIASRPLEIQLTPDSKVVIKCDTKTLKTVYFKLDELFRDLS